METNVCPVRYFLSIASQHPGGYILRCKESTARALAAIGLPFWAKTAGIGLVSLPGQTHH
jgi:hypothetical protein